jgi:hypothetical protein
MPNINHIKLKAHHTVQLFIEGFCTDLTTKAPRMVASNDSIYHGMRNYSTVSVSTRCKV